MLTRLFSVLNAIAAIAFLYRKGDRPQNKYFRLADYPTNKPTELKSNEVVCSKIATNSEPLPL